MEPGEVTRLLKQLGSANDNEVISQLFPVVYRELHQRARARMRRPNQTMEAPDLVNQAFLKLVDQKSVVWQNRAHFFAIASTVMRNIVVDRARRRNAEKRGGGYRMVPLDEALAYSDDRSQALILLDRALTKLSEFDNRQSRVVEMRFFGGLTTAEIAEVLGVAVNTVYRDWRLAEAWLKTQIAEEA
jgi:RNA polymerase sigma factor (TIGR02999 family)